MRMSVGRKEWPYVLNLANSIMGVSLLAMPFCFMRCGILLGTLLLLCSTYLTTVTCHLLMKASVVSKRRSYEFLAHHLFGASGKFAVEVGVSGLQLGTCIAFHVIIGDLGPALISKWLSWENSAGLRASIMVISAITVSLPLSMMRHIESITKLSALSIGFYIIVVCCVFGASWQNLVRSNWTQNIDFWNTRNIFQCLPIFAMAFGCQTQMFLLYDALPDPSLSVLNAVTKNGVNLCMVVYLITGFFGYIAFFDKDLGGDVLLSFNPSFGADLLKFGFVISVALSFPLMVFPCRQSLNTLLFSSSQALHGSADFTGNAPMSGTKFNGITAAIILGTLCIAINFPNVEFILGMNGSTMGCLISFIFPAVMFLKVMDSNTKGKFQAKLVLLVGVCVLCMSTYSTLQNAEQATDVREDLKAKLDSPGLLPLNEIKVKPDGHKSISDALFDMDKDKKKHEDEKLEKEPEPEQQQAPVEKEQAEKVPTKKPSAKDGSDEIRKEPVNPEPPNTGDEEKAEKKKPEPPNPEPPNTEAVEVTEGVDVKSKKSKIEEADDKKDAENSKDAGSPKKHRRKNRKEKAEGKDDKVEGEVDRVKKETTEEDQKPSDDKKEKDEEKKKAEEKDETHHKEFKQLIDKLEKQGEFNQELIEQNKALIEEFKEIKKEKEAIEDELADTQPSQQTAPQQPAQLPVQQLPIQQQPVQQQPVQQQPVQQQPLQQPIPQQALPQQPIQQQPIQQPVQPQVFQQPIQQQPIQQPIQQQAVQQPMQPQVVQQINQQGIQQPVPVQVVQQQPMQPVVGQPVQPVNLGGQPQILQQQGGQQVVQQQQFVQQQPQQPMQAQPVQPIVQQPVPQVGQQVVFQPGQQQFQQPVQQPTFQQPAQGLQNVQPVVQQVQAQMQPLNMAGQQIQQQAALPVQQQAALPVQQQAALPVQQQAAFPAQQQAAFPAQQAAFPAQQQQVVQNMPQVVPQMGQQNIQQNNQQPVHQQQQNIQQQAQNVNLPPNAQANQQSNTVPVQHQPAQVPQQANKSPHVENNDKKPSKPPGEHMDDQFIEQQEALLSKAQHVHKQAEEDTQELKKSLNTIITKDDDDKKLTENEDKGTRVKREAVEPTLDEEHAEKTPSIEQQLGEDNINNGAKGEDIEKVLSEPEKEDSPPDTRTNKANLVKEEV